jgi:ABC-2 type transport system ATP-binding protein
VLFSSHILSEVEALCERVIVIAQGTLVGQGSTADLARDLGARQRVLVRVEGSPADVRAALAGLPDVRSVEERAGAFAVEATGSEPLARRVGEAMQGRGWLVVELRQETLDLEDVFLELVRTGGRA